MPLNPQANQQNDADIADAAEESAETADTAETTEEELEIETTPAEKPAPAPSAPAAKPAPQKEEQPLTFQQSIVKKAIPNAVIRNGQIVVETPMPEE